MLPRSKKGSKYLNCVKIRVKSFKEDPVQNPTCPTIIKALSFCKKTYFGYHSWKYLLTFFRISEPRFQSAHSKKWPLSAGLQCLRRALKALHSSTRAHQENDKNGNKIRLRRHTACGVECGPLRLSIWPTKPN